VGGYRRNVNSQFKLEMLQVKHALITGLPRRYNFKSDPRALGAVVVLSADESTYTGEDVLILWVRLRFETWT
jgi:hypothetical protein